MPCKAPTYCFLAGELVGLYEIIVSRSKYCEADYKKRMDYLKSLQLKDADIDKIIDELKAIKHERDSN